MKITLILKESIYDCKIKIADSQGVRYYYISALDEDETTPSSIIAEVFDHEFSLSLIPMMTDTKSALNEFEENNWKDKLVKKAAGFLVNSLDKTMLRVGCNYHIVGLQDDDYLDIALQTYAFGTLDRFNILELLPVCYMFFEVSNKNDYYKLTDAYETNRKDVLKLAKNLAILSLSTYPIQIGRVKYLTRNKKIKKVLTKFNNLSDTERQRFLEKQEKFFSR